MPDLDAAAQFIAGHARLIDRRRFACLEGDGSKERLVAALEAHRNEDGGIGHLEPDLRTPASQTSCLRYTLDILEESGAVAPELTHGALDWLQGVTNSDGGVPFVLASARGWPHAPWWTPQDDPPSSMLMTAGIAAQAHRLRLDHPWVATASVFCWERARGALEADPYTVRYLVDFLDAAGDHEHAEQLLDALAERLPADGLLRVEAGTAGEVLRPLDVAPRPDHAGRRLFSDELIERELDALADGQQDDGGWMFSWASWNPVAAWEWRGAVTIDALKILRAYGRL